jgi:putative tryptophan/tyrosine transport system substrate-binding protein
VTKFREGLMEAGFTDGQNITVEYHSAEGQLDRLRALVAELVRRPVAVIVANGLAAQVAKAETTTVPIVFASGGDPIKLGLVTSVNRPGGNVTGVNFLLGVLGAKRLDLLRQFVPKTATIGFLVNPNTDETEAERSDVQAAARAVGQPIIMIDASSARDIETAFETFARRKAGAVVVGTGNFTFSRREPIVSQAARYALPAIYTGREAVEAGGLMSYGPSIVDDYRQAGTQAGRILKGEKAGDLPVIQSTKFEFVINLKTAKTLGLEFHPQLLGTADDVIE